MQNIGIFYFSGTGNTAIVTKLLSEALTKRGNKVEFFKIEKICKNIEQVDFNKFDLIGIGHPVLGFGASGIAEKFVKLLPESEGKQVFVFKTASSPHYINHGASDKIIAIMEKKGYSVFHNSILAMPCNWYMKYDERMNKQLYEAAVKKVEVIAEEIVTRKKRSLKINFFLKILLRGIFLAEERQGAKYFAEGLEASNACSKCQKCVRECPMSNISEVDGEICFGSNCIWCMRCIYSCPEKAIEASHLSGCVLVPYTGGINIETLLNDTNIKGDYVDENSKGYYKHFIKYFKGNV